MLGSSDSAQRVTDEDFLREEDPEHPGWLRWTLRDSDRFNSVLGPMWARKMADSPTHKMLVRTKPGHLQGNLSNNLHGGAILTQIDIALFVCARTAGALEYGPGVTLEIGTQFYGAGKTGVALDCEVEILRETGRLLFMRGLVLQEDVSIGAFTGTIRKTPAPRL